MAKTEFEFQTKALARLKRIPKSWWFKAQLVALCGIPDIIGIVDGRFVALELKRSLAEMKPEKHKLQNYVLTCIEQAGGYATFVCPETWDSVLEEVESLCMN